MIRLQPGRIDDLCEAVSREELDREKLLAGVNTLLVASIPPSGNLNDQVFRDLHRMNVHGRLGDGTFPLAQWLRNAASLAGGARRGLFEDTMVELGVPPETVQRSILDMVPFPWGYERAKVLREQLASAYGDPQGAMLLAKACGVDIRSVRVNGAPRGTWNDILTTASEQGKLRALVESALTDPEIAGYHDQIRRLIEPFDPDRSE